MLTFDPNGFKYTGNVATQVHYWDPRFHGFAGDLAVQSILSEETSEDVYSWVVTPPIGGFIEYFPLYPAPVMAVDETWQSPEQVLEDIPFGITPKGIILGFSYCPANMGGARINVKNFDKSSALYPFTLVQVTVTVDPEKIFKVQTNSPFGLKASLADDNYLMVNGAELYTVEVQDSQSNTFTYSFPLGNLTDNTGGSRCYLFQPGITDSATMLASVPVTTENLQVSAEAKNLTSGITDNYPTSDDETIYPYVYVDATVGYAA